MSIAAVQNAALRRLATNRGAPVRIGAGVPPTANRDAVSLSCQPVEAPAQAAVLPGANPMLLNAITFNISIAALGNASLSMPLHLQVAGQQGDITYSLPLGTNVMQGEGTFDGKPWREKWTFGHDLQIEGSVGDAAERLKVTFDDKTWRTSGQVGATAVDETLQFNSKWDKDIIDVKGKLGDKALSQTITIGFASADGASKTSMQGDLQGEPCAADAAFQTLQDRIVMTAGGKNGQVEWSASGAAIFVPADGGSPGASR